MKKRLYQLSVLVILFISFYLFYGCETVPVRQEPLPGSPVAQAPKMFVGDTWSYKGYHPKHGIDVYNSKIVYVESDGGYTMER